MNAPAHKSQNNVSVNRYQSCLSSLETQLFILVNIHIISNGPRPLAPEVTQVAGIHFKPTMKLPEVRRVPIITPQILYVLYNGTDLPMNDY